MRDDVRQIQTDYPQIYLACHTRHQRAASSGSGISARDSAILSHLDERRSVTPGDLARHLAVGLSTLSAAIKKLEALGYVDRMRNEEDARHVELRLTPRGADAMRGSSVLDAQRVGEVLERLTPGERRAALKGLGLLARASREVSARSRRATET